MKGEWCIARVVSIDDPDKRQRIQVRCPKDLDEESLPDESLDWIPKLPIRQDSFTLPEVDTSVLLVRFGELTMWTDLPNKQAWQSFGDDYATAWMYTHKDKLICTYTESDGFTFMLDGEVALNTLTATITMGEAGVSVQCGDFLATTDGSLCTVKLGDASFSTDGSTFNMKVKDVDFSTNGTLVSLKNGQVNLAEVIDAMMTSLQSHVHATPTGPSSPPTTELSNFIKQQQQYKMLLK